MQGRRNKTPDRIRHLKPVLAPKTEANIGTPPSPYSELRLINSAITHLGLTIIIPSFYIMILAPRRNTSELDPYSNKFYVPAPHLPTSLISTKNINDTCDRSCQGCLHAS